MRWGGTRLVLQLEQQRLVPDFGRDLAGVLEFLIRVECVPLSFLLAVPVDEVDCGAEIESNKTRKGQRAERVMREKESKGEGGQGRTFDGDGEEDIIDCDPDEGSVPLGIAGFGVACAVDLCGDD